MADKTGAIWQNEVRQLENCVNEVQKNIDIWTEKKLDIDKRTKELYDHYHSDNPELISDLMVSLDRQGEAGKTLFRTPNSHDIRKPGWHE
jgi:hypothetical protein